MKLQKQVTEFHEKFGLVVNEKPVIPDNDLIKLRINLIREEVAEFENELNTNSIDLCAVAKELADILYVVVGTAVSFGIDLEPVLDEVHRSNMSKVWEDGTIKRREDGKILKPPTYSPAKIKLS